MPTTPDDTPHQTELNWAADSLAWGNSLQAWGGDASLLTQVDARLRPEQLIVAACRSIMVESFPVFQEGKLVLPSVVFACTGVVELEGFQKTLTQQTYILTMRAKTYSDVIRLTEDVYHALRQVAANRFRGVSSMNDGFADEFEFRTRVMQVIIQR